MNLWVNFGLKFTLFYKGKMAKISPKINKIEIWPKSRPKVINSRNKSHIGHLKCHFFGLKDGHWSKVTVFGPQKMALRAVKSKF